MDFFFVFLFFFKIQNRLKDIRQCNTNFRQKFTDPNHALGTDARYYLLEEIRTYGENYHQICSLSRTDPHLIPESYQKVSGALCNRLYPETGIL